MKLHNFYFLLITSFFVAILFSSYFIIFQPSYAWINPSQNPPLGGGVLQTDTSGLKIVTTTQITSGNFTVNTGNVGIGTTAPSAKLHVAGAITSQYTAYDVLKVGPLNTSPQYFYVNTKIQFYPAAYRAVSIMIRGYGYGRLDMNCVVSFYTYVGTGWIGPKFHCEPGKRVPSSIRLGTWDDAGVKRVTIEVANDGIYWSSYVFSVYMHNADPAELTGWTWAEGQFPVGTANIITLSQQGNLIVNSAGNVGIGTTNPGGKLHVNQNVRISPFTSGESGGYLSGTDARLYIIDGDIYDTTYGGITFGGMYNPAGTRYDATYVSIDFGQGQLRIRNNQQEKILIGAGDEWGQQNVIINPTGGNVGIGTTAPGAKLEVQGQVKIVDGTQGAGKVLTSDANGLASWQTPPAAGGVPSGYSILGDTPTPPPGYTYTGDYIQSWKHTWTTKVSMPTPRRGLAAVSPGNGKIYAIGGYGGGGYLSTNEEYDPATNTWTTKAPMPTARAYLAAASPGNGKIYAIGGLRFDVDYLYLSTNEEYDPATNTWTTKAPMPTARAYLAAASPGNGKIYAIGGHRFDVANLYLLTNEEYDPATNTWTTKAPMPTPRRGLAAVSPGNGKIYAIGGYRFDSYYGFHYFLSTNEEYDPASNTWTTKAPMPTARADLAAASSGDGKIYAIGGWNGSYYLSTNEEYDPATNTWTTKASMPTARADLAAASHGNGKIYAIGGWNGTNVFATNEEYFPNVIYYIHKKN
ncbi:MAG: hypothetical protein KatS3mg027_2699 [Bacteroidia bacterium]|nr:MAG: hypothetical protein KatS3mg027_2699 [Bacteroidia bacterium]